MRRWFVCWRSCDTGMIEGEGGSAGDVEGGGVDGEGDRIDLVGGFGVGGGA